MVALLAMSRWGALQIMEPVQATAPGMSLSKAP
jgi:hypothetical protein